MTVPVVGDIPGSFDYVQFFTILGTVVGAPATIWGIIWAVVSSRKNERQDREKQLKLATRQLYQTLELASLDLFRFEADHQDLIAPFWQEDVSPPPQGTAKYIAYINYFCQQMNLFEMAVRFRVDGVLDKEVFSSWLEWFHLVAGAPDFRRLWDEQKENYVSALKEVFEIALLSPRKEDFYENAIACLDEKIPVLPNAGQNLSLRAIRLVRKRKSRKEASASRPFNPVVRWSEDARDIPELVDLFLRNARRSYISQGEIFCGRAQKPGEWASDLPHILTKEFGNAVPSVLTSSGGKGILAAWVEGRCAGLLVMSVQDNPDGPSYGILEDIVVDKVSRGQGLASKLLNEAEKRLAELGISLILLESGKDNEAAHKALHGLGFDNISVSMLKTIGARAN
jgi:ribosomal protein S18 acetylase RimI-like enzyme